MKKVLLVAPQFNQINDFFARSIRENSCEVSVLEFSPYGPDTALFKMLKKDIAPLISSKRKRFNESVWKQFCAISPDIVIIIRGDYMDKDVLKKMKTSRLILWMYDSVRRYPEMGNYLDLYDEIYSFDPDDVTALNKRYRNVEFLPLGYDEKVYFPMNRKKDIDICFVGALYPERIEFFERLIEDFPQLNIEIYGIYQFKRYVFSYMKFLLQGKRKHFKNKKLCHKQCNELYNRSKICLNILPDEYKEEWNARFFELNGSGSFQIVTNSNMTQKYYKDCVATFVNYEDLKQKIQFYLDQPEVRREVSQQALTVARKRDRYIERLKKLLQ